MYGFIQQPSTHPQITVRDPLNMRLSSSQFDSIVRTKINITIIQGNYLNYLIHDIQQIVPDVKLEADRTACKPVDGW